jgi:hypothetical protein
MDTLLHRLGDKVKGVITGFDRIVFKGRLQPLCYSAGMTAYLNCRGVLNKDYKSWNVENTAAIVSDATEYSKQQTGAGFEYLGSSHTRKESIAHMRQNEREIAEGFVCGLSSMESCRTYKATFDGALGFPQLKSRLSRCKHLYYYFDHKDYGFMSVRLQTWAPFEIQIALNGREWLKRQLAKSGVSYALEGNKFLGIDDFGIAQKLLNAQVGTMWVPMLDSFVPTVFPSMHRILGDDMSYTWTLWQSEWAKDYIFSEPAELQKLMPQFLRHAFLTGTGERVLQYMGSPVKSNGQPYSDPELTTRYSQWYDGACIKHRVEKNSVKMYNELNVLRFEFTMNDPTKFKVFRHTEGKEDSGKSFLPMRKGIADVAIRTQICEQRIHAFTEQVASLSDDSTIGEVLDKVKSPVKSGEKSFRGLAPLGKDLPLLQAIGDPKFNTDFITNKDLREMLESSPWANGLSGKKLSARVSRNLRLLREHGIIKKEPKQHSYRLTDKGRLITTAISQLLGAKLSDLAKLAA